MTTHISQTRSLYQEHILNTVKLIDLHSYLYTSTGYEFHKQSYDHLVQYIHSLKQYIKEAERTQEEESREADTEGSANGS